MFRSDLPSGRRRLFLFVCAVFLIAGFSVKALIYEMGWVGKSENTQKPIKPAEMNDGQQAPEPPSHSEEDLQEAKSVVEAFLPLYIANHPDQKEKRLEELKKLTTTSFFEVLKEESDSARPVEEGIQAKLQQVEQLECSGEDSMHCVAVTTIEEQGKEKLLVEKVFVVFLAEEKGNWLVREVEARGSFD